jgi:hypothetical protein
MVYTMAFIFTRSYVQTGFERWPSPCHTSLVRDLGERAAWKQAFEMLDAYGGEVGNFVITEIQSARAAGDHDLQRYWLSVADKIAELVTDGDRPS